MTQTETLPHWDLSEMFPALDAPELSAATLQALAEIGELEHLFDQHDVQRHERAALSDAQVATFELVIGRLNRLLEQTALLNSYLYSFISTDSRNTAAQAQISALQQELVRLSKLNTRLTAWLGSLDIAALKERSQLARDHAFMLQKAQVRAAHQMEPALENLAAELGLTGGSAWGKLYSTFTSQLLVPFEQEGEPLDLPMSAIRNLAFEADRTLRQRAYQAELAAWKRAQVPISAALNSIKGEVDTLAKRRGWHDPLEIGLFENNIDQATLDAMLGAAREAFPDFRRYLKAKARALGLEKLAFYDMFAPVGQSVSAWSYEDAKAFVASNFGTFSPRLRELAERAFAENWIDVPPREGKVGGAFCMRVRGGESRILTNYKPSFSGVSTLAHELGHAYHNLNLGQRSPLQRATPMTLAETASIFCETIVVNAALEQASPEEQLGILEASLQDSTQVVVDITSRFVFEGEVLRRRQQRELSAEEFCQIMRDAQLDTYGDGLDAEALHPYMWAAKPHYYGSLFYNYPYMFGLLFALGLYARYQADPAAFKGVYDDLLAATGLDDAATLAARFGIDIRSVDFWRASLNVIRSQIDRFEGLVGQ
ncbi:MAG: M3 family oligoendopeptidase [Roseiflexaceae bacterium]|nr:M3 family oligoendopeptidase [Roseiflexaceae bacterium]